MLPIQRSTAAAAPMLLRAATRSQRPAAAGVQKALVASQQQSRAAHAISNPTLANIEKRWEAMPPQEQADLWMALRDRMKVDWNELTLQEKKAAYWIAFGPHGPRAQAPPGENAKVLIYTLLGVGVSAVIFGIIRHFAGPAPRTMTKEYQEATNEYLKEQKVEPISLFTEDYKGTGMVQSKPEEK
ncbi:COX4-domain-containing protein [Polychaeton citri CBS 116435]|uniref:Cytochrome c oxidase polypeptide V n=1 Tax=Polychaeton citri CBS 116435 TaxID=1314669 RepID=A0A9P4UKZ7_9PEZI|nr:COX4-domain-containing protein [Polychaeton citri CBS 116435]